MKVIISCRRNPSLSRTAFFNHLRNVHWPLIQRHPGVLAALGGYIQNHALGEAPPGVGATPFRLAAERDSVIELFFGGPEDLARLVQLPEYEAHIRPDEAHFNDLSTNVMARTRAESFFSAPQVGRCKRFDFIVRNASIAAEAFAVALADQARRLALDPLYTAHVDRHVHNYQIGAEQGGGFGQGQFDCVREVWASDFRSLAVTVPVSDVADADRERSFSVLVTEFIMKAPASEQ